MTLRLSQTVSLESGGNRVTGRIVGIDNTRCRIELDEQAEWLRSGASIGLEQKDPDGLVSIMVTLAEASPIAAEIEAQLPALIVRRNRRAYPRRSIRCPAEWSPLAGTSERFEATALDISRGGLRLLADRVPPTGPMAVAVHLPAGAITAVCEQISADYTVEGMLVRCRFLRAHPTSLARIQALVNESEVETSLLAL